VVRIKAIGPILHAARGPSVLAVIAVGALAIGWPAAAAAPHSPVAAIAGPIGAVGLMGVGMIGAAAAGRLGFGLALAVLTGAGLAMAAWTLGITPVPAVSMTGIAVLIASTSFAARGALFARSVGARGWWVAVAVVAGEAALLLTASAMPGALPRGLLALLPAQWASAAITASLDASAARVAGPELAALAGTAAATLLVRNLWPRRWPYLVMFTTWLGLSALVYHYPS
jgi:hypothetical protein